MNAEQLQAIKALAEAATPGEWELGAMYTGSDSVVSIPENRFVCVTGDVGYSQADAEFIAAARTAVPQLVAEVERLTAERDDAQKELNKWLDWRLNGPVPCYSGKA